MDFSQFKNKKVLVVDDFANVRKSIKSQLLDLGIGVVSEAQDGDYAQRALKDTTYDLILCDYNLGKGRDGVRLLEEWRLNKTIRQDTTFVLITAETSRELVISALENQPDDYLAKPFTGEVLANRLSRWFERRQTLLPLFVSLEKKDWEAVTSTARDIIENHPRHRSFAQKAFVESMIQQNQLTEAEHFLLGLLEKRFQGWAQTALHRLDLIQNKYEAAESGLKAVLIKDPNMIDAYDYLVEALEALENEDEQLEWLEKAVARSPKNINRQKKLVHAAQQKLEFHTASTALRAIMNMSLGTMHESVGVFISYIQNLLVEEASTEDAPRKREIGKEINSINRRMNDRYSNDQNARLFSKALSVIKDKEPASERHDKKLNELYSASFESIADLTSEAALFISETFYKAERFNDADEMVKQFKNRFSEEPDTIRQFDALQAEPISMQSRQQAKALNLKGIELYKSKQFDESIQCFRHAMELSPRHPGIILNFVQSHLLKMKQDGVRQQDVELCLKYIERLNYLPEDHYQYERFSKLKQNLKTMV